MLVKQVVRQAVPVIRQLHARGEAVKQAELERARRLLARGDDPAAVLEALAQGLTSKFLHAPTSLLQRPGEDRDSLVRLIDQICDRCRIPNRHRQLARLLAVAGARVMLVARRADQLKDMRDNIVRELEDIGYYGAADRIATLADVDVADESSLGRAVEATLAAFGRIDYLVNNAGVTDTKPLLDPRFTALTIADIAARLHLSAATVRNYLSSAIGKTGTRNKVEAARLARENGWL